MAVRADGEELTTVLVVTAVQAELDALGLLGVAVGVGPVAAAVGTARALGACDLVVCAGIAGGFAGRAAIGDLVVGRTSRFADLGAATDEGFLDLGGLGLAGGSALSAPGFERVAAALRSASVPFHEGEILTLATMTGTDARAAELAARHPGAVAEAMEGYGVAAAAEAVGVPWVEIRAISNLIGRRDRATWDLPAAFEALRSCGEALRRL